jgi:2-polyprenyl-6-methoxyphenol hydroxylase-like FAD-dependent oxidoreductase
VLAAEHSEVWLPSILEAVAVVDVDVLVAGAGPTGLALAAHANAAGASVRVVDRAPSEVHESRALVLQPRTLEVLAGMGITARLLGRGRKTVQLQLHGRKRVAAMRLFDLGLDDTPYPFLLFLSQAQTEAVLSAHLADAGVAVERATELVGLTQDGAAVHCTLRRGTHTEQVSTRYAVGCDGGGSTVRGLLGVDFVGGRYPQRFALADVDVDGPLRSEAIHTFLGPGGMLFLFPLGAPKPWRVMGMLPADAPDGVTLASVQALLDEYATGLRAKDPAWLSDFRLRHRLAARYRVGRVFLAGDAAHVHSPAGGQGMNLGIQDAANLGWKLAAVSRGADPVLLDSYEAERLPVGGATVDLTDRLFSIATSRRAPIRFARTVIGPRLLPAVSRIRPLRAAGFRRISGLDVAYRRSPVVLDRRGPRAPAPRAGDRLPDAATGSGATLHQLVAPPGYHVLLCGPRRRWNPSQLDDIRKQGTTVHLLEPDDAGEALERLRTRGDAHLLIRPDGHIAYRADGTDLTELLAQIHRTLPPNPTR